MSHTKQTKGSSSKSSKASRNSNTSKKGSKKHSSSSSSSGSTDKHQEIRNMERFCDEFAKDIKDTTNRADELIERVAMKTFHDIVSNSRQF